MSDTTTHPTEILRDYQVQGVNWLQDQSRKHRALLLCDEAGLGKTLQTLAAANRLGAQRILVICPAGARRVWQLEVQRWLPAWSRRVLVVEPGTPWYIVQGRLADRGPLILVVGYDELSRSGSQLLAKNLHVAWDLLVLDEAHYLKNLSNRTLAIYGKGGKDEGIQAHARKVILLTGTPTPNHAGEMYQHCRAFWPKVLPGIKSQAQFEEAYTRYRDHQKFGRQIVGSKNQDVLRKALAQVVLRRRKSEVLAELPPLQVQDMPLVTAIQGDEWLSVEVQSAAHRLSRVFRNAGEDDDEVLRALRSLDGNVAALRHRIGVAKVPATVEWVQERMASVNKVLVFAWHRDVIEALEKYLLEFEPAVVTGGTSPRMRSDAVAKFQGRPQTRLFLGQIQAAGTAITLTAASEVAIVEPSWVPGENTQAICRAHRLGQRDSVLASFLYLPGTLDERIMRVFRRKASEIGQLQGDFDADLSVIADRPEQLNGQDPAANHAGADGGAPAARGRGRPRRVPIGAGTVG